MYFKCEELFCFLFEIFIVGMFFIVKYDNKEIDFKLCFLFVIDFLLKGIKIIILFDLFIFNY